MAVHLIMRKSKWGGLAKITNGGREAEKEPFGAHV